MQFNKKLVSTEIKDASEGLNNPAENKNTVHNIYSRIKNSFDKIYQSRNILLNNTETTSFQENLTIIVREINEISEAVEGFRAIIRERIQKEKTSEFDAFVHDIRQPLNIMKILCQSILRDIDKDRLAMDKVEDDLSEINKCIKCAFEMIEHFEKSLQNDPQPEEDPEQEINLNRLIEQSVKMLSHNFQGIRVIQELDLDLPLIQGSADQLSRVISNIIINAKEALEESDKEEKHIVIETQRSACSPEFVTIKITDNGVGIPRKEIKKIFSNYTSKGEKGTGIGLSLARQTIEDLGGWINVASRAGKGTRFKIFLPSILVDEGQTFLPLRNLKVRLAY